MQHGDISNKVAPRVLIVFEGALGFCTDQRKFEKALSKGKVMTAIKYWELNQYCLLRMEYLFQRKDVNFEVVTFLGKEFAEELRAWLDEHGAPVMHVWNSTPQDLARRLPYMHDLATIYDPEPSRWLTYGKKGRWLDDISRIGEGL